MPDYTDFGGSEFPGDMVSERVERYSRTITFLCAKEEFSDWISSDPFFLAVSGFDSSHSEAIRTNTLRSLSKSDGGRFLYATHSHNSETFSIIIDVVDVVGKRVSVKVKILTFAKS